MDSAVLQEALHILAFSVWLGALVLLVIVATRQAIGLRTGKLIRVKRLLLVVSLGLVSLGLLPLVVRLMTLLDQTLDPTLHAVASLMVAVALLVTALAFLKIYGLDPYDPKNNE